MLNQKSIICFALFLFLILPMVSSFEFDNIKADLITNKDTSEYGKIEIRNSVLGFEWWQLDKVMSLELKENTYICSETGCLANTEIIMYEDGKLFDSIRFIDLYTGRETNIKGYKVYVNGRIYNYEKLKEDSQGIKYDVELKGEVYPFQKVDWQVRSAGTEWIEDWAVWTSALTNGTIGAWTLDETSGINVEDSTGNFDLTTNSSNWTTGLINNGLAFNETGYRAWNDTFLDKNMTDISFSFWFKVPRDFNSTASVDMDLLAKTDKFNTNHVRIYLESGSGKITISLAGEGQGNNLLSNYTNLVAGTWYHVVLVWDGGSNNTLYVNGEFNDTFTNTGRLNTTTLDYDFSIGGGFRSGKDFNGTIDEVVVWNRILLNTEIQDLYNSGLGISFAPLNGTTVTLNAPADNFNTTNRTVTFNCTAVVFRPSSNITNVSLYHNETGTWTLNQTNSTERRENSTAIFEVNFQNFRSSIWNCESCDNSSTCNFGINRTLNIESFAVNEQTFNNNTIEGASEDFTLNVTLASGLTISESSFVYDGNSSIAQHVLSDGNTILTRTGFIIPNIGPETNLSFNWELNLSDSSSVSTEETNQTVTNVSISNCTSSTNNIFNFTLVDEEAQTQLSDNLTIETAFNLFTVDRSILITNFSTNFSSSLVSICLSRLLLNNTNFSLDVIVKYEAQDHATEYFNVVNFSLTNSSEFQNITLFDLLSADSTEFQLTFTGSNFVAVEDALIFVMRQYISENVFKTVELPKTDSNGQTILHLVRNDIIYNINVLKGGEVLGTFNNIIAFCEDVAIGNCKINLDASSTGDAIFDYNDSLGITFTGPTFNNDTRVMSFNFLTTDGNTKTVTMEVSRNDIFGNRTLCNSTLESSGGALTCTVPDIDDSLIITRVFVEGEETVKEYTFLDGRNFGKAGYFIFFVFMLSFILMFNKSKTTTLIGIIVGFIAGISLGLIEGKMIGIGASGVWLSIVLILMLWKLNKERPN
ncbi:hypothetical protein LCGC14_1301740 [marine sediment metagenome]|uniref:LamG-like jellyroll fold domain-containing protein n=1 Tax=marine sediment metagenome TaxID=412755 RepID=A0A0F9LA34_9ZZZZ